MENFSQMNSAQKILLHLLEDISENDLSKVIDYVAYLKKKKEMQLHAELEAVSESSLGFWDSEIDDKVWNNV
jgi:hypothetical protein